MILAISKAGIDVLTETNPNNFIFHSDYNTFKIIATGLFTGLTVDADPKTFTLAHSLGVIPSVYALAEFPDGYTAQPNDKERAENSAPVERYWRVEVSSTTVYFVFYKGSTANYNVNIRYYVFETPM